MKFDSVAFLILSKIGGRPPTYISNHVKTSPKACSIGTLRISSDHYYNGHVERAHNYRS